MAALRRGALWGNTQDDSCPSMTFAALPTHELAALATAICWAATSLIAARPAAHLGAVAFSRLRQLSVALLLAIFVTTSGRLQALPARDIGLLLASGAIGIFIGDSLLFAALNRLGPRRSGILFALNAPMAAVLGFAFLGESLSWLAAAGVALCVAGVMLAVFFGRRPGQSHALEQVKGALWIGVALGLGAALGQAIGSVIARPLMASGLDPFVASLVRVSVAGLMLSGFMLLPIPDVKQRNPLTAHVALLTVGSGVLAMGIGMTLLLFAFSGGKTGIVSTLSATSPALVLPLLWITTKERPAAGAWAGAGLVIFGMALLFAGR
jgi:drug/metabolite transporter (DMT)-like permease